MIVSSETDDKPVYYTLRIMLYNARNRHLHISLFLKVGWKWLILRPLQCMFVCSDLYLNRFGWDGMGEQRMRDMRYSNDWIGLMVHL